MFLHIVHAPTTACATQGVRVGRMRRGSLLVRRDEIRESYGCELVRDLPDSRLRLLGSWSRQGGTGRVVEKGGGEPAEDAEFTTARRSCAREACVEALL